MKTEYKDWKDISKLEECSFPNIGLLESSGGETYYLSFHNCVTETRFIVPDWLNYILTIEYKRGREDNQKQICEALGIKK